MTKNFKVYMFTRFVFIHFVCTFCINILGKKIDLEIPSGLAQGEICEILSRNLVAKLALDLLINSPRFQVNFFFKSIITNEDKNIPSRSIYLGCTISVVGNIDSQFIIQAINNSYVLQNSGKFQIFILLLCKASELNLSF